VAKKESLKVAGMSCAACAARIEKGLNRLEGVESANVNLALERVDIEYDDKLLQPEQFDEVIEKLGFRPIRERGSEENKITLKVSGMTCAACSARVEKKLNSLAGVQAANVNLTTERATVDYHPEEIKTTDLIKAIQSLGYEAEKIEEVSRDWEAQEKELEIKTLRNLLVISIALSLPLLLSMLVHVLGLEMAGLSFLNNQYFQLAIATPIQFVIGARFYKQSYYALRSGSANMDVLVALGTSAAYFFSYAGYAQNVFLIQLASFYDIGQLRHSFSNGTGLVQHHCI
jgi:Cu+-exporting ATPase